MAAEIEALNVPVHPLHASGPSDLAVLARLARLIHKRGYTHVLSFLMHANAAAALSALLFREVRFFQSIQTTQPQPAWHWPVQALAGKVARKILVPSPSVAEWASARCDLPEEKFEIIPNAINLAAFAGFTRTPGPRIRIGFLGRLDPIKRIPDLIAAYQQLSPDRFALEVFGTGPELPRLQHLAQNLPGVTFHGSIPTPRAALERMDLLVLPSQAEGFGLVLLEAMATQTPIIASNAPGIRDVVQHQHNGLLFPVGDTTALTRAIQHLSHNLPLIKRLTDAGLATVREKYVLPRVLDAYEKALGLPPQGH